MSDNALPRKRRFWQLHLSTAIVLSLVAGYAIHCNFLERKGVWLGGEDAYEFDVQMEIVIYGWPSAVYYKFTDNGWYRDGRRFERFNKDDSWRFDFWAIIFNLLSTFVILVASGWGLEWLIRRREGRKP
jgi:hypothetical protein